MAAGIPRHAHCTPNQTSAFSSHPLSQMESEQHASASGNWLHLQCDSLIDTKSETSYMDTQHNI